MAFVLQITAEKRQDAAANLPKYMDGNTVFFAPPGASTPIASRRPEGFQKALAKHQGQTSEAKMATVTIGQFDYSARFDFFGRYWPGSFELKHGTTVSSEAVKNGKSRMLLGEFEYPAKFELGAGPATRRFIALGMQFSDLQAGRTITVEGMQGGEMDAKVLEVMRGQNRVRVSVDDGFGPREEIWICEDRDGRMEISVPKNYTFTDASKLRIKAFFIDGVPPSEIRGANFWGDTEEYLRSKVMQVGEGFNYIFSAGFDDERATNWLLFVVSYEDSSGKTIMKNSFPRAYGLYFPNSYIQEPEKQKDFGVFIKVQSEGRHYIPMQKGSLEKYMCASFGTFRLNPDGTVEIQEPAMHGKGFGLDHVPMLPFEHLSQNFPNPFNNSTTVGYSIPHDGHVKLAIFDALGRKIRSVVDQPVVKGAYGISIDTKDLASGAYFLTLELDGKNLGYKKMMKIK